MVKIKGVDKTEATFGSVLLMDFLADGRLDRQKGMERGLLALSQLPYPWQERGVVKGGCGAEVLPSLLALEFPPAEGLKLRQWPQVAPEKVHIGY